MKKGIVFICLLAMVGLKAQTAQARPADLEKVYSEYKSGDYEKALSRLEGIEAKDQELKGLLTYWKGLCLLRLNEFDRGINELEKAIKLGYKVNDLYYEYGQALYTSLKLKKARVAFKQSILQRYKTAVSMYYIASISHELGDYKTAASFYNGIERLPASEKKEVIQAARMQLGDIYLEQVSKQGGGSASIEKYVLPQYRKALEWDKDGPLSLEIKKKIETIERRYELVLFQLRNGRPTLRPAHFLKANIKYTQNDNVNAVSEETKDSLKASQYAAASTDVGVYGRYAFYPNSSFSLVPQFNFGYTNYLSDEATITRNNGYFATATLQGTYEHTYKKTPATLYLNLDHTYTADDADEDEEIEKASTTTGFTLSEEVQLWKGNSSFFRFKHYQTQAVLETSDKTLTGASYEQMINVGNTMFYLSTVYELHRYDTYETENNDALTFRLDVLLPDFKGWFNTNLYGSVTQSDYVEDADRGKTQLNILGINLNRPIGKHSFVTLDFANADQSADLESDAFQRQTLSLNFDYIF